VTDETKGSGCPHLEGYRPLAPEQLSNPFDMWARARREAPVFYSDELRVWTVTRYEDVRRILTDYKTFSNYGTLGGFEMPEKYRSRFPEGLWSNRTLINRDPPEHTRAKKLAQKAFTPRRVVAMEPSMRELANALVERVADMGRADLMANYANPFAIRVIAGILGIPEEDVDRLRQGTEDALVLLTPGHPDEEGIVQEMPEEERLERLERLVEFDDYLRAIIQDRRADPRDDVISGLIHAEEEGQPSLTNDEVVAMVTEQVVAGNDTSANMIGHAVLYLRREPGLWEEVRDNRELLPAVVEETVRRHTPSKGLFRRTTRPVRLSGVDVPEGALLHVLWGSANTDEEKFEDPLRFDPRRPNLGDHVGFGRGTHFCLGSPLAKLQGQIALGTLLDRLPELDVVPDQQLRYAPALTNVSLLGLEVRWPVPVRRTAK
jgi:cytochrome P450